MTSRTQVSTRRRRNSSGTQWIELALVLLPTMAILSGFFDVTFAIFNWTVIQNAVREGCRYAVTFQTTGGMGQDASIGQTVMNMSMGLLPSGTPIDSTNSGQLSITINYYTELNPNTVIAPPSGNTPGNIVEVSVVNYNLQWMVPIAGTIINPYRSQAPATINVYARDVLNGYPAGVTGVAR
ncbi:MAG TPA: TadE family protein [Bryobacteraceae bacterium]|nr:TadE family protein [Bryobacteraceae bacterium]